MTRYSKTSDAVSASAATPQPTISKHRLTGLKYLERVCVTVTDESNGAEACWDPSPCQSLQVCVERNIVSEEVAFDPSSFYYS